MPEKTSISVPVDSGPNPKPLTVDEIMQRHVTFEHYCIQQAKLELSAESDGDPHRKGMSAIEFMRKVCRRAQEIKDRIKGSSNGK